MKRLFAFFLAFCVLFSLGTHPAAAAASLPEDENPVRLSSLDDEQCRVFLAEQGVSIPEELNDINLPELFSALEEDADAYGAIEWPTLHFFIEDVRAVVKAYYGIHTTSSSCALAYTVQSLTYTLQYSSLYQWNAGEMPNYNCYAYVLGRKIWCQPGDFSNQSYDGTVSIAALAEVVKDDLNGDLGFDCVKVQSSRPTSTSGWSNVIAVRKDTTFDSGGYNDFHFAKLSSSSWYHKPGGTAVLKFNSAPSNSVVWTNECYDGMYHEYLITYDSELRYLLYKANHGNTTYTWTGEHYHSGSRHYYRYAYVCNDCGDYVSTVWTSQSCSGPPCATPWSITPVPEVL